MLHSGSSGDESSCRSVSCCQTLFISPGISHHALLLSFMQIQD